MSNFDRRLAHHPRANGSDLSRLLPLPSGGRSRLSSSDRARVCRHHLLILTRRVLDHTGLSFDPVRLRRRRSRPRHRLHLCTHIPTPITPPTTTTASWWRSTCRWMPKTTAVDCCTHCLVWRACLTGTSYFRPRSACARAIGSTHALAIPLLHLAAHCDPQSTDSSRNGRTQRA